MKIIINAGHWKEDSGATRNGIKESDLAMQIRDTLKKKMETTNFKADYVPDDLDLRKSIDYAKLFAGPDDIAIDIHLNANSNKKVGGVEVFYAQNAHMAEVFARNVSKLSRMTNRGARHDSESYVGSLGWLRQIPCRSVLIECGYITNDTDFAKIMSEEHRESIAQGIIDSIVEIETEDKIKSLQRQLLELLQRWYAELKAKIF